jgi:type IV pilus assembly protein PilY1
MNKVRETRTTTLGWRVGTGAAGKLFLLAVAALLASLLNVTPSWAATTWTITVSVSGSSHGSVSPSSNQSVTNGNSKTFTISPSSNYIANVTVDGTSVGNLNSYTFSNVTGPHSITVTFAKPTITASSGTGGTISPTGATTVNSGSNQTYTMSANTGFAIADVLVDGVSQGPRTSYTFTGVTTNHTIAVSFNQPTYTITVTPPANGTISPGTSTLIINGNQTFTIAANPGYGISDVQVDGSSVGAVGSYTFTNVTTTHTIAATFVPTLQITASAGTGGTISPNGGTAVNTGSNKTFTIVPNATYAIADVAVDGVSQGAITSYTFTYVTTPHTIAASFVKTYTITASSTPSAGGTITPTGSVSVNTGTNQSFTILATTGYAIQSVLVDGVSQNAAIGTSSYIYPFTNVTAAHSIAVTFNQPTYNITVNTVTNGTVSPAPGTYPVTINGNKTFTFTPATGYVVSNVSVDGTSVGAPSSYTFTNITMGHTLSVTFQVPAATYTITASAGSNGSINPSGAVAVNRGASQTFTFTPNSGQAINNVVVDGVSQGAISSYTFTNVTTTHTISASFAAARWTITTSPGAHSTIQPSGTYAVADSSQQKIYVTYNTSLKDLYIQVNGVSYQILGNGAYQTGSVCVATGTLNQCVYTINSVNQNYSINLLESFNITDFPLDIQTRPAPPNIMFVYDDSGSMDWEVMTPEVDGTFNGEYYVYDNSDYVGSSSDDAYSNPVSSTSKAMWQLQWSGYNKMFYDPTIDYTHWPTLTDAAMPPATTHSHPYATNPRYAKTMCLSGTCTGNYSSTYTTINGVAIPRAHYYVYSNIAAKPYLVTIDSTSGSVKYYKVASTTNGTGTTQTVSTLSLDNAPPSDVQTTRTYDDEMQNFANWFSFYRRRFLSATMAMSTVIDQLSNIYVGIRTINYSSSPSYGLAIPLTPVRVLYLDVNNNYAYLDQASSLQTSLYGLNISAYGTPLRIGLQKVGQYFDQTFSPHEAALPFTTTATATTPTTPWFPKALGGECQQSFAVAITDGFWNETTSPGVGNADGNKGAPYADSYSNTLADVAMYYYQDHDLVPDTILANKVPGSNTMQHLNTFGVSFGVGGTLNPNSYNLTPGCTLGSACNYPVWPDPTTGVDDQRKIDDLWHATVNGRGSYVNAADPMELVDALLNMVSQIIASDGSAASVSVNGDELYMSIGTTLRMYQTRYKSPDWTGDIIAYGFNADGTVETSPPVWQAASLLNADLANGASVGSRLVATLKNDPTGPTGVPFKISTDLTATQQAALTQTASTAHPVAVAATAQQIIDYIRGSNSMESATGFRVRDMRLGDIVDSTAVYNEGFIYAGANDGMLHAFNAVTGHEAFAYVPNLVIPNLSLLTSQDYSGYHRFFVDNSPFVWTMGTKTYLVGGLGKGGKGYYCLDITNPTAITNDSVLSSRVKWEYPQANTPAGDGINDLGYSFSRAFLVDTNAHGASTGINPNDADLAGYAVVFGNGYSSTNGNAVLYFLNPATGQLIRKIDVGHGPGNGLSTPVAVDVNNDGRVDYYYAGDLHGNLWKFDVTDPDPAKWQVAYCDDGNSATHCQNTTAPQPLFTTKDNQPITSKPDVMKHESGTGYMVIFGTGRYLDKLDWQDMSVQSIYGIWDYGNDNDDTAYLGQLNADNTLSHQPPGVTLLPQTSIFEQTVTTNDLGQAISQYVRVLSQNTINWAVAPDSNGFPAPAANAGWYFDLPLAGERVTSDAMIRDGKAIITSFVLQDDRCTAGAESIVQEIDANSGGRLNSPTFDLNSDKTIGAGDYVNIKNPDGSDNWVAPSGIERPGRMQPPAILRINNNIEAKYFSSSNASIQMVTEKAEKRGVYFWKQQ